MERKTATIKMKKVLKKGVKLSAYAYECIVNKYEEKTESIYLNMTCPLEELSLDAIYECRIRDDKNEVVMTGRILERYKSEEGDIARIHIETGFYKNSIK